LIQLPTKYTFDGVEYAPPMYKIIMRLATINSIATTQTLHNKLQSLRVYAAVVSSNIDKVHNEFHKNYSQLIARGATVYNPIGILVKAYLVVPCHNFKTYIHWQHKDYLDSKPTAITHEALMTSAKRKFDWLKTKAIWGAKSLEPPPSTCSRASSSWTPSSAPLQTKETRRVTTRQKRRRTRKTHPTGVNRKRMRRGRKSHQRTVKSTKTGPQVHLPMV
jgi:hypothetical protein